jgi:hypothetical protein
LIVVDDALESKCSVKRLLYFDLSGNGNASYEDIGEFKRGFGAVFSFESSDREELLEFLSRDLNLLLDGLGGGTVTDMQKNKTKKLFKKRKKKKKKREGVAKGL